MTAPSGLDGFVGRGDPLRRIGALLDDLLPARKLRVVSVSGPGGVGKTFLLDRALASADLESRRTLVLRLIGSGAPRTLAQLVTHDLLRSAPGLNLDEKDTFRELKADRRVLERMDDEARLEAEKSAGGDRSLLEAIAALHKLGVGLQEVVPFAKQFVNLGQLDSAKVLQAAELLEQSRAYQEPRRLFNGILPDVLDPTGRRSRLRGRALYGTLAEDLVADLGVLLWPAVTEKGPSKERLILVLDDYEQLAPVLGGFLLDHLLPLLAQASFPTLLFVLGRDRVLDAHLPFQDRLRPFVVEDLRLAELGEDEARAYIAAQGVTAPEVVDRIWTETRGYPYLLASEVEAELSGGRSALSLTGFYQRITRWMTPEQRAWLLPLAFLDEIDEDAIAAMIPEAPAAAVLDWFKGEASIRSPTSARWTILPVLRSRLRAYVKNDSAARFQKLTERAEAIGRPPSP